jgi:DNA-binding PucR family transcriptional regulator
VLADDLLPERALDGDADAIGRLVDDVYLRLVAEDLTLVDTLTAYLERTGSLEGAARELFVHPNTVRYRLRRVADVTGLTATQPRDAWSLRLALSLGRLSDDDPHRHE